MRFALVQIHIDLNESTSDRWTGRDMEERGGGGVTDENLERRDYSVKWRDFGQ